PPSGMGNPGVVNPKGETDAQTSREATLRSAEMPASADQSNQRRLVAALDQMKLDFKRIQLIRNDMIDEILANKPFNYKRIAEQTAEVNKRANRLKGFMMPAKPEDKKKGETENQVELNSDEVKASLIKLCNLIRSFTNNPMFKDLGALDLKESSKANGDLLSIIEISENVRRNAERLSKSSK
ncbi:MAG TPA: hypothetical protein VKB86_11370, partial [Pyrinomonadaceae bacterium]|nr:hypothetical protein [Pyrinomonadaceae bacterium]